VSATDIDIKFKDMAQKKKKTGNRIRYSGVYRLYRNGVLVKETPYSLLDAFGNTPAITIEELELMTTQDIEARAALMIEHIADKCTEFNVINNVIYKSDECSEEEEFMIGQIIDFAGIKDSWDVEKWTECDGRIANVADYPELYAVIGKEWTHDTLPETQFRIPNLRGRVTRGIWPAMNETPRSSPDVGVYNDGRVGNTGGSDTVRLVLSQIPSHNHGLKIFNVNAEHSDSGHDYYPAQFIQNTKPTNTDREWTGETQYSGGGAGTDSHENRQPYAVVYKLIRYK
jgi:microcystin-dependent protein